jgi:DNA-binding transcriptional ArsR family regulator
VPDYVPETPSDQPPEPVPAKRRLEMDATTVKVLAHPMRVQILRILQLRGAVSVTSLAAELSETTGATSYHLRQLARHGMVEQTDSPDSPDSGHPTGRKQRWWRMAVDELHMTGFAFLADEDTRAAVTFLLRETQVERGRTLANWYQTATEWPEVWQRAASDMDAHLELNPEQTRALADELYAVIDRYDALPAGTGARRIDVQYAVFPSETGDRP